MPLLMGKPVERDSQHLSQYGGLRFPCQKAGHCSFGGKAYLCSLAMPACVRGPGTPGLWQWTEVTE